MRVQNQDVKDVDQTQSKLVGSVFRSQIEFLDQLGIFRLNHGQGVPTKISGVDAFEIRASNSGRVRFQTGRELVIVISLDDADVSCTQMVSGLPEFIGRLEAGFCSVYAPVTSVEANWKSAAERKLLCIVMQETWYSQVLAQKAPALTGVNGSKICFQSSTFHRDDILANLGNAIRTEITTGLPSGGDQGILNIAESCLVHVFTHHSNSERLINKPAAKVERHSLTKNILDKIDDFIQKHLAGYITVDAMAEVAHISKFHFIRSFRRATGYTPYEYLIHCRVNKARELITLNPGRSSLAEVASDVGFYDQSHLNRHFKQIVGMTPKQFAMSVQVSAQAD